MVDRWTDGWMGGGLIDRWMDRWIDGQMDGYSDDRKASLVEETSQSRSQLHGHRYGSFGGILNVLRALES